MPASDTRGRIESALASSYTIVRELGGGGMSNVFVAEEKALGRMVVIKLLSSDRSETVSAERFVREIKLVARLQHPHIVPLFSTGTVDGLPYYTMPFVDGESLRARLGREGHLRANDAIRILHDIARALEYAHAQGVIHRDIKPDNILISGSVACVADFGIARALKAARTGPSLSADSQHQHSGLTRMGMTVGTPAYMSPEQATSSPDVDHRTDIYSFGCVAFELLTGSTPFAGKSPQATIVAHIVEAPPIARLRNPRIPPGLADLVVQCLKKNPDERPATATDVLRSLESISRKTTTAAPRPEAHASIAVLPFENMSADKENEYFADGITEEIINALTQIRGLRVAGRTSSFAFKGAKVDLANVGEKLNVDTVLEGSVRKSGNHLRITAQLVKAGDGYHLWSERFDRELDDVFAIQDEIASAIASKLKLGLDHSGEIAKPLTTSVEAYEMFVKGRALYYLPGRPTEEAISLFAKAIALDEKFALAYAALGEALSLSGYYGLVRPGDIVDNAIEMARRAVDLAPDAPDAHHAVALWETFYGNDREKAIQSWSKVASSEAVRTTVRCSYGILCLGLLSGKWTDAIDEITAAIALDPLSGFAHSMLAFAKTFAGQMSDVIAYARRGIELHQSSFWGLLSLQHALHCAGMHAEAQKQGLLTLDLSGRHPFAMSELAVDYASVGDRESADALYQELKARSRLQYIQPSHLALAAVSAGLLDEAIAHCERALEERDAQILWAFTEAWDGWQPLYAHPKWSELRDSSVSRRETH